MRSILSILGILIASAITFTGQAQLKVGDQFSGWLEGYLDIHHINTGKGECSFFILPDGTTMLVDAGATARPKPRVTDPKPDGSRTPGEWISRYIQHFLEKQPSKKIDYVLLTHFHDDHIGELYAGLKSSESGNYILSGITEVAENLSVSKLVDRNWPDYNYPSPLKSNYIQNYIRFVKWNVEQKRFTAEQFRVGANDQFTLLHNPKKYNNFEIRNMASNGWIWTGVENNVRNHFPSVESLSANEYPAENMCSSAFRLSYGKFDYFNGGDLTTGEAGTWQDIETPVGLVSGPVDVCVANHHAYYDAMGVTFLKAVRPRVHIVQVWSPSQPSPNILSRMLSTGTYPGPRDIFATNTMEETRVVSGRMESLKSQQGHIVVRVNPGGEDYMIYILDDSSESFRIKAIHGPYNCN
jgi:hypothetical protein